MVLSAVGLCVDGVCYFSAVTGHSCKPCPQGWLWLSSSCYLFTFQDFYGTKNWPKAQKFCQAYGGDLAIIDTTDKEVKPLWSYYVTLPSRKEPIDNRCETGAKTLICGEKVLDHFQPDQSDVTSSRYRSKASYWSER